MKELYIIRHGQTLFNVEKRVQGRGVDSSLNEVGLSQRNAFYDYYKNHDFDLIVSSSLKRTYETILPFVELSKINHLSFPDIDEISWGIYEGKPADENLIREHAKLLSEWKNENYEAKLKEGESALEMQSRLLRFLDILKSLIYKKILICTHGGTLAFLMTILQRQPLSVMPVYKHNNTGLCKFNFENDEFRLLVYNDTTHLSNKV
jgi:broad specificity phosphatase PhoE